MIPRAHLENIRHKLIHSDKIILLFGPRQVGKTTLIKVILKELPLKVLSINADENRYIDVFSSRDLLKMQLLVADYDVLYIDEAQRIPDIGINLKILHDALPQLKIIATGSSSFELANRTKEPLTGRTWTFTLFPIALLELKKQYNDFELTERLTQYLQFGMYPEVLNLDNKSDKIQLLYELTSAYLYKDVLEMTAIKNADKLSKLLQLLALQIGSEVSLNELASSLQISKDTVATYIDLLEKAFVVFRLSGFNRNLRKEITKMDKIYFYDIGIRNALIDNFNPIDLRNDTGALWENFLIAERRKRNVYLASFGKSYFWRTYTGAELDYIEESSGQLCGFEFKWSKKAPKPPKTWTETYLEATFECINKDNCMDFLTP
jgi:uncharacterized protein